MTKIGLYQHEVNGRWEKLRDYWLEADRLGYDNAWMMDNTVFSGQGVRWHVAGPRDLDGVVDSGRDY